ncbi:MAG TPA: GYF domain-containing protein [Polyangiaceae bacterium]|nr:GYF domain-containing protein [Polyangiaceae bacterium]
MKFLCEQCKAKYQIADEKAAGKTVRMKCRKCGYLIEVRAAATEGSASASQPPSGTSGSRPPPSPKAAQRPTAPRATPLATSLASARSPAKPGGPLASALKSALQREEEVSAPVDMSDLSPSDEWYVAINGVPVGPIRIGEVRRKAAIGAVTDESLCWQEGLDEWRPLRSFPELAALVREAFSAGRSSMTPPPPAADGRSSLPPPARTSMRPAAPAGTAPRAPAATRAPATSAPPPAGRSNVVPFTARLATAEKLAEPSDDLTRPFTGNPFTPARALEPSVQPDPFAAPPRPNPAPMAPGFSYAAGGAPMTPSPSMAPGSLSFGVPTKKGPPWMAIAMVAAATAFGITAAVAVFLRPAPQPTPVVVQVPGVPATVAAAATATATTTSTSDVPDPGAPTVAVGPRPVAMAGAPKATPSAAAPTAAAHGPLDLHGLTGGTTISPVDDPGGGGSEGPKAPGQCISEGQVQQVIGLHSVGLRRACWERSTASKTTANVTVSLTIAADGSAQGVSASGDEASVASCIASDVRNWHFPAMGCSQRTAIPFHFVRQ